MDLTRLALFAASGDSTDTHTTPSPEPGTGSEITLCTSDRDGVVALIHGPNWLWARTTLDAAGFEKTDDGLHAIPLSDLDRTREALLALGVVAKISGTTVATSSDPYIGDFAREVADHLPGQWTARVENYALHLWQDDLADCLWSEGPIADRVRSPGQAMGRGTRLRGLMLRRRLVRDTSTSPAVRSRGCTGR
ncbi:hypothetical protein AB0I49_13110 [Streptomyces sp. NPDC050617]|uniref:hypothetical protein n=1 Tax=Streptomyces sp. NPDC050617 TaxID=3154628 RepID=UPI00344680AF